MSPERQALSLTTHCASALLEGEAWPPEQHSPWAWQKGSVVPVRHLPQCCDCPRPVRLPRQEVSWLVEEECDVGVREQPSPPFPHCVRTSILGMTILCGRPIPRAIVRSLFYAAQQRLTDQGLVAEFFKTLQNDVLVWGQQEEEEDVDAQGVWEEIATGLLCLERCSGEVGKRGKACVFVFSYPLG